MAPSGGRWETSQAGQGGTIPALLAPAFAYCFLNSCKDSPSFAALAIDSRALRPPPALLFTVAVELLDHDKPDGRGAHLANPGAGERGG